jgi:hypothetical protein
MRGILGALIVLGSVSPWLEAAEPSPIYFSVRPFSLTETKARLSRGDEALGKCLKKLVADAEQTLQEKPPTVMDKTRIPPSGDKHDYMSTAPYFWPDPQKKDGLPYFRQDGKVNPECRTDAYDGPRVSHMAKMVESLALAYYLSGEERYAVHAASCLRVWFVDPATRMNPHLNFAQAVPGLNSGRGEGVLEGRNLAAAAGCASLLSASSAWKKSDNDSLQAWLREYFDWLLTNRLALAEAAAKNNHGTYYDAQVMRVALLLGKTDVARKIAGEAGKKRFATQIAADGSQPLELQRTTSLSYSRFNLEALFDLATLAEHVGVDLWHDQAPGSGGIQKALDFLLPYINDPKKPWPYKQIKAVEPQEFAGLLLQASRVYQDPDYSRVLSGIDKTAGKRIWLLHPAATR